MKLNRFGFSLELINLNNDCVKTIFVSSYLFVRSQTSLDHLVLSSEARRYLTSIRRRLDVIDDVSPLLARGSLAPRSGLAAHLTPTKRKRKQKDGTETNYLLQGQCCVCTQKTTSCCSQCLDESIGGKEVWICGTKKGKMCYVRHMHNVHGL
jgi:hypothetical protein